MQTPEGNTAIKPKSKSKRIIMIVAVVLLIVLCVGWLVFYFYDNKEGEDTAVLSEESKTTSARDVTGYYEANSLIRENPDKYSSIIGNVLSIERDQKSIFVSDKQDNNSIKTLNYTNPPAVYATSDPSKKLTASDITEDKLAIITYAKEGEAVVEIMIQK